VEKFPLIVFTAFGDSRVTPLQDTARPGISPEGGINTLLSPLVDHQKEKTMSSSQNESHFKAYGSTQYGLPEEVLHVVEVAKPQLGPRDLLVRVVAVATNPADHKKIANYSGDSAAISAPLIAGWDASGVVEAVGSHVSLFKPGDDVFFAGTLPLMNAGAKPEQ
jgi:hypothetical protein